MKRRGGSMTAGAHRALLDLRADYALARPSRFRKTRVGLGGSADAHLTQREYDDIREQVRAMDRDDGVIGQLCDRSADNVVHRGFTLNPMTGDKTLDRVNKMKWAEYWEEPDRVDVQGQFAGADLEWQTWRATLVDGDNFILPLASDHLQVLEGDRCITPSNTRRNVVLGVLLNDVGRPLEYWFAKDWRRKSHVQRVGDVDQIPAWTSSGERNVYHPRAVTRTSQTRGLTPFHAIADIAGMFDDANFAKLVQQQIITCFGLLIEQDAGVPAPAVPNIGTPRHTETDGVNNITLEELSAGLVHYLAQGQKATTISPNLPAPGYFEFVTLLLRMIGAAVHCPLVLTLLDSTKTNFHGFRAEMEQAKRSFTRAQDTFAKQFHRPIYQWRVRRWMSDPAYRKEVEEARARVEADTTPEALPFDPFRHRWDGPRWRYLDPEKDAKGDQIRLNTLQVSPVQLGAERGYDAEQVVNETIAHNKAAIIKAITARDDIETATSETVPWQMLLRLTAGETDVPDAWAGEAQGDELDEQPPPDGGGQPGDRFAEVGANGVHP